MAQARRGGGVAGRCHPNAPRRRPPIRLPSSDRASEFVPEAAWSPALRDAGRSRRRTGPAVVVRRTRRGLRARFQTRRSCDRAVRLQRAVRVPADQGDDRVAAVRNRRGCWAAGPSSPEGRQRSQMCSGGSEVIGRSITSATLLQILGRLGIAPSTWWSSGTTVSSRSSCAPLPACMGGSGREDRRQAAHETQRGRGT